MAKKSLFGSSSRAKEPTEIKEKKANGGFKFPSYQFSGAMTKRMKRMLSMRFFKFEREFSYYLAHIPARSYGALFISFGLLSLVLYYIGFYGRSSISALVISIIFTIFSLPFLLTDRSLPVWLQDNPITDFIFFEFFSMRRVSKTEKTSRAYSLGWIILGFVLAFLGRFIPIWQIVLVTGIAVFVYLSFSSPEFAFFTSFTLMPFSKYIPHSEIVLSCLVALTFLSFVRKVLYGKRVINVEKYDIVLLLMSGFILVSGVFVKGAESFSNSIQMLAMGLGYILAGNVITNRRLADRTLNSLIFSWTLPAAVSIVQLIVKIVMAGGEFLTGEDLDSIFVRADGLSVYMLVSCVLS